MRRVQYHITFDHAKGVWVCAVAHAVFGFASKRSALISAVAGALEDFWKVLNYRSELVIHRKDGTIGKGSGSRRTYGADPKGSKG